MSGGLVKDRSEFAIFMGVRLTWIENLEEIRNYRSDSGQPLPRVKWGPKAIEEIVELLNGNHQFKLLQEQVAQQVEQLREVCGRKKQFKGLEKPSSKRQLQQKTDEELEEKLKKILKEEGLFAVRLFDLGEWIGMRKSELV